MFMSNILLKGGWEDYDPDKSISSKTDQFDDLYTNRDDYELIYKFKKNSKDLNSLEKSYEKVVETPNKFMRWDGMFFFVVGFTLGGFGVYQVLKHTGIISKESEIIQPETMQSEVTGSMTTTTSSFFGVKVSEIVEKIENTYDDNIN